MNGCAYRVMVVDGGGDGGWAWVVVVVSCGWWMAISAANYGGSRMAEPQLMEEMENI